jgi:CrcB protein
VTLLFVIVGGAIGAPLRYLTDLLVQSKHDTVFPWGTLTVNVLGSLVLGGVLAAGSVGHLSATLVALLGTGLCGALTTFSTFGLETVRLVQQGSRMMSGLNIMASLVAGFGAGAVGWSLTLVLVSG